MKQRDILCTGNWVTCLGHFAWFRFSYQAISLKCSANLYYINVQEDIIVFGYHMYSVKAVCRSQHEWSYPPYQKKSRSRRWRFQDWYLQEDPRNWVYPKYDQHRLSFQPTVDDLTDLTLTSIVSNCLSSNQCPQIVILSVAAPAAPMGRPPSIHVGLGHVGWKHQAAGVGHTHFHNCLVAIPHQS